MPNIASAEKNMRKTRSATVRNRAQRSALRTALKKAKAAGASAEAQKDAVSLLDRAARKGLIHKNAAAR
ncbi:MAG: 30S ribosomal protein S20, partial [Gemmatimonadaceae bacterium]